MKAVNLVFYTIGHGKEFTSGVAEGPRAQGRALDTDLHRWVLHASQEFPYPPLRLPHGRCPSAAEEAWPLPGPHGTSPGLAFPEPVSHDPFMPAGIIVVPSDLGTTTPGKWVQASMW